MVTELEYARGAYCELARPVSQSVSGLLHCVRLQWA